MIEYEVLTLHSRRLDHEERETAGALGAEIVLDGDITPGRVQSRV
jgi:hypothetical protein